MTNISLNSLVGATWAFNVSCDCPAPDDGSEDLFAHFSEVQGNGFRTLEEGQKVRFEPKQGPKGKQAGNIQTV